VLFQLDDSDYTASLKKNRAQLELAIQAEARSNDLLKSGGTSLHHYEEAVSHRKVLEAEGELLMVMIEKAKIRAPFSGKTGIRRVSTGAYLAPGQVLTSLEDLSTLEVEFTVPQDQAGAIAVSNRLEFRIAGNPDVYQAVVHALDPSVDIKTGNLKVLARVLSAGNELVPGISVTVNMVSQSPVPARFVPTQALIPSPSGYNVYRVAGGKCTIRQVATGFRTNEMVEITGGIEPGDTVLLTGFMKVKPGSRVRINKIW
jgi:membrane fusion protein (multidrug efflux system)